MQVRAVVVMGIDSEFGYTALWRGTNQVRKGMYVGWETKRYVECVSILVAWATGEKCCHQQREVDSGALSGHLLYGKHKARCWLSEHGPAQSFSFPVHEYLGYQNAVILHSVLKYKSDSENILVLHQGALKRGWEKINLFSNICDHRGAPCLGRKAASAGWWGAEGWVKVKKSYSFFWERDPKVSAFEVHLGRWLEFQKQKNVCG